MILPRYLALCYWCNSGCEYADPWGGDITFTIAMQPDHAIMVFATIYCPGVFGGAITAILFNIPGAPENAPTC